MTDDFDTFGYPDFDIDDLDPFAGFDAAGDEIELETSRQLSRPKSHAKKAAKREFINGLKKQALTELIPSLPPPDVDLYVIGNGAGAEQRHGLNPQAFDFGSFIPHLVEMLGGQGCTAYVSSWTMNENHVKNMGQMLNDGRLEYLTVCSDPYFQRRTPSIYAQLVTAIQRHAPRARYLAFKNHVKVIALANADNTRFCTITGSANLSAQPRCEQYVLTTAPDVYRFFVDEFFGEMFNGR